MITKEQIASDYQTIQDEICLALEQCDGKAKFEEEVWERDGGVVPTNAFGCKSGAKRQKLGSS